MTQLSFVAAWNWCHIKYHLYFFKHSKNFLRDLNIIATLVIIFWEGGSVEIRSSSNWSSDFLRRFQLSAC